MPMRSVCQPGGTSCRESDAVYRFPITAINLANSLDLGMTLNVPFKGQIPMPPRNYSSETLPDGTRKYRAMSHYETAISDLQVRDGRLEIVLGMENWAASLKFDVREALAREMAVAATAIALDPVEAARARAKKIDRQSLNAVLQSAAYGGDVTFAKALIEAGADPKNVSETGWTALMVAATYGSPDMVRALIMAGSDLNASDKNCGGWTVLMWAARSGKEPKTKVSVLLKAGADRNGTNKRGSNVLMAAVEDLPTFELLIRDGFKLSFRNKNGLTVLMAAAATGSEDVVKAIIDRGADINASDKEGMTALMYAAITRRRQTQIAPPGRSRS